MAKLEYTAICPACGRIEKGKRREGRDVLLSFVCKGRVRSGHLCGQRYTLKFFDEDSDEERSKDEWLRGEGDEFTDFKLR